ncbi:DsbA family protein [Paracoccus jeotgali]|uniref:DsbA family protein n=1 Tax=Paracoccus jeotgali TaxID=2065379 RepID=UPI0028A6F128|nr:DsbA family protein [Paracoccus jeotgali]
MSFDFRRFLSVSLISAAMALPVTAQTAPQPADTPADAAAAQPQIQPDLFLGAEDAPLTIYEYASYTCPHCATFHQENLPKLKAEYIDTGKVRFALRDVYFDQVGLWAGILARCDSDKFYPVAGLLMEEQSDWLGAQNSQDLVANLRKIGAKAGMTGDQMDACWNDQAQVANLVATFQQNAEADKINATPTFMIGGEQVENMAWDQLKARIDEKLAEAEAAAPAAQ